MAKKIDARISLKTDGTGKVVSDVQRVTDSVKKSTFSVDTLNRKLSSINFAAKVAAVSAGMQIVGSVVSGIGNAVSSAIGAIDGFATNADTIAKFSRNVGMSAEQLQSWRYAAERSGMSINDFDKSIRKFSVNVAKAAGGERTQLDVFNALGVSLKRQNGTMKTNSELLLEVSDAYTKINNAQDKLRVSEELFGKGGMSFGTMFEGGSAGLQDLLDRRRQIGGFVTAEDAKNAETFKDVLLDVQTVKDAILTKGMSTLLPSVTQDLQDFLSWWDGNSDRVFANVKIAADVVGYSVRDFVDWIGQAIDVFSNLGDVVKGLGITFSDTVNSICDGIANGIRDAFVGAFEFVGDKVSAIVQTVRGVFASVLDGVSGLVSSVASGIASVVASLFERLSALPVIGDNFARSAESIRQTFAPQQKNDSTASQTVQTYTENRNTTTMNRLQVDFTGMPKGASVTPSDNFDFNVIDYSAGYTFGY